MAGSMCVHNVCFVCGINCMHGMCVICVLCGYMVWYPWSSVSGGCIVGVAQFVFNVYECM